MAGGRETFATRIDPNILDALRGIAQREGREIEALIDEALADLIEKRRQDRPRAHVMATYQASHERFGSLYKKLAE